MKRIFLAFLLLFAGFLARAGEPYVCLLSDRTLEYERHKANGRLERTTTMQYTRIRQEGDVRVVEYVFTLRGPGGGALYGGGAPMATEVTPDGTVRQDLGASLRAVLHNMFPGAAQSVETVPAEIPSGMRPGDRLPDARCAVKTGIMTHTIELTERVVLRFERIRVPAGEFDCVVIREHKVERGVGRNRDTVSESWYARGIGPVRHDTYRNSGGNLKLEATEVLKNY
ncbi:MAG: hypothetical protein J6W98_05525 [Bacteroidales bacterium]|nr:hypothetical protein [Bacteroidales bacterium]